MIKLNQIKVGTVVYDRDDNPLRVVVIDHENNWWQVLCDTTEFGGWVPTQKLINKYGLSPYRRYWGFSLEELCQCQCHTYEVE